MGKTATLANIGSVADSSLGFRNRIINGAMVIDQRNAGASVTASGSEVYPVDRWVVAAFNATGGGATLTGQQSSTAPTGFNKSIAVTVNGTDTSLGTNDLYEVTQRIEGNNTADLGWGASGAANISLSFWVRSSVTGTYSVGVENSNGTRAYVVTYTISAANTWEYKTFSIPGDTTGTWGTSTGIGIQLRWCLATGTDRVAGAANAWSGGNYIAISSTANPIMGTSGATFYITGVQLEKGATATSFDYRPYGTELGLCQRYYYKQPATAYQSALLDGGSSDYPSIYVTHPVEMRTTPSTTFESFAGFYYNSGSGQASFTPSGGTTGYAGNARVGYSRIAAISNGPGATQIQKSGQWTAQLSFSAEL